MHNSKQPLFPGSGASASTSTSGSGSWAGQERLAGLTAHDVYVKHSLRCQHSAPPTALCCDARTVLVGYADGFVGSCTWGGKVRASRTAATSSEHGQQPLA